MKIADIRKTGENVAEMFFSEDLPPLASGCMIENITANPEVTITNCRFGKANTHLRFQNRGKTTK